MKKNNFISNFQNSNQYRSVIHDLIPGGAHTYSKGDDQFPVNSPAAISHGKGAYVWDLDGNKYLDTLMGLTSVSLGHAYGPVIDRVKEELLRGSNFSRPSIIEREMAERFLSLVPQHDMIKYAKNGSVVTTAAIKLARAATGRNIVARTAEHPFYSYDDWFIGSTECDFGVPRDVKNKTITFKHNNLDDLERMFQEYPGKIACIIGEPEKWEVIEPDFYQKAIAIAHKHGALWIMDEMITGFKTDYPGSIKRLNADPDMSTWGKGIANGFSFCALTGKKEVMKLGGIKNIGDKKLFLVSTTHGGETSSIAAGLATMDIFEKNNVIEHNKKIGQYFIDGVNKIFSNNDVKDYFELTGFNWNVGLIVKNTKGEPCMFYRTLFMQEMIKRGILYQGILSPCYSMTENDIDLMLEAFNDSVKLFKKAIEDGYEKYLVGSEIKPVFRKYN